MVTRFRSILRPGRSDTYFAEPGTGADALQRSLFSRCRQQVSAHVRRQRRRRENGGKPSEALQGVIAGDRRVVLAVLEVSGFAYQACPGDQTRR
jgi:hypothetical protein